MLKKHILVFLILFFFVPKVQSEEKIAFIDLNLIYNNSTAGKKINEEISERNKKIKSEFENFQKKLDKEKEKLVKQKNVIAKEEYQKKVLELEKKVIPFIIERPIPNGTFEYWKLRDLEII